MSEKTSMLEKIEKIDRRVIYVVLIIAVIAVLLNPIGLPVPVTSPTIKYRDAISSLPPGSLVYIAVEFEAASLPENGPQLEVTMRLLIKHNMKFVLASLRSGGPAVAQIYLDKLKGVIDSSGKRYGEDFVLMPYLVGGETAAAALAKDFKSTAKTDLYGKTVGDIPILRNVKDAKDFSLAVCITSGTPGVEEYLRQWVSPYNVPMIVGALGVAAPTYMPYFSSGQIKGMLGGLRGAAELEILAGAPSAAVSSMDALSAGHLVTIIFILLGNVVFFLRKREGKVK